MNNYKINLRKVLSNKIKIAEKHIENGDKATEDTIPWEHILHTLQEIYYLTDNISEI